MFRKEYGVGFFDAGDVLLLDLGVVTQMCSVYENLSSYTLRICVFLYVFGIL